MARVCFLRFMGRVGPRPLSPSVPSNMLHSFGHFVQHYVASMLDVVTIVWPQNYFRYSVTMVVSNLLK